jgi:hypothetical protein
VGWERNSPRKAPQHRAGTPLTLSQRVGLKTSCFHLLFSVEDGPVEDVPIGNEFSHVNNRPLTIEDFELLKVMILISILDSNLGVRFLGKEVLARLCW